MNANVMAVVEEHIVLRKTSINKNYCMVTIVMMMMMRVNNVIKHKVFLYDAS